MNSNTIWRAHGTRSFAVLGALILAPACGNESINVLAPRDARADTVAEDAAPDVSIDVPSPDDGMMEDRPAEDGPAADISIMDGPQMDAPTVDTPTVDTPTPDPPTIGCGAPGEGCSFAGGCCRLSCPLPSPGAARVCAADGICATVDDRCGDNADCCSNRCESNRCVLAAGRCRPAGEYCAVDGDCCGGVCTAPAAGGPTRCARLDVCSVFGEVCVRSTDCCSGQCNDIGAGNRFCALAPPCGIPGNMCRGQAGDRCEMKSDCCSVDCIAGGVGPLRCAPASCRGQCALCAETRDCCTGQCIADESGYRRCENPIW